MTSTRAGANRVLVMSDRPHERDGAAGRAFIVQFLASDDYHSALCGRVERIASGESRRFHSGEELLAFMVDRLGRTAKGEEDS
jgi:hypothetical protein